MRLSNKVKTELLSRVESEVKLHKASIRNLDPELLEYCLSEAGANSVSWTRVLYDLLFPGEGACETCGGKSKFRNMRVGYARFCTSRCRANSPEHLEATRAKLHNRKVRAKIEQTNELLYGGPSPMCSNTVRRRARKSLLSRSPEQIARDNARRNATMLERYGVEHNMQSRELWEKQKLSGFKSRSCKIGRKTFTTRGYEDIALAYLHTQEKIPTKLLINSSKDGMPSITWKDKKGTHVYHPDIYTKFRNRWTLIEVKSTYTSGIFSTSGLFSQLKKKVQASVDAGFRILVMVIDRNGEVALIWNLHEKTRSQVRRELEELEHLHLPTNL